MELIVPDFVSSQNLFQELRKDALSAFKEQLIIRRCGDHYDVAALLRLIPEIPCDDVIDHVHGLRSATKPEDSGIGFAGIVVLWEHDLVTDGDSSDVHGLIEDIGLHRNFRQDHKSCQERQGRPSVLSHIVPPRWPRVAGLCHDGYESSVRRNTSEPSSLSGFSQPGPLAPFR